ncbi:hypothetical protein NDU88_006051 [Pleurodeles waltl]|uniref:Uncharacterized protein n=1 Tax=Pleurodeles waltl TaxID=8319 RepID=A0AAV7WCA7_PLEWA|nr:hypothetical protein NDU88_006051 [Pleurodeles waltl]
MFSHSNKGTQTGKSQLEKAVQMLANPAPQESVVYSLDNLFPSMSSVHNSPPVPQDVQKKEFALIPRAAPFTIFLPKDHSSFKLIELIGNEMEKAGKQIKIRGKNAREKRNQIITKKKARKVKFEEREDVGSADVQDQVPIMEKSQNGTEEVFPVLQQMPDMGSSRDHRQTDYPVMPCGTFDSIDAIMPGTTSLRALDTCSILDIQNVGEKIQKG